jgi:hypothetical protein
MIIGLFHYSLEHRVLMVFRPGICGFDTSAVRLYLVIGLTQDNRGGFLSRPNIRRTDFCYFRDTPDVPNVKTDSYPLRSLEALREISLQ